MLQQQYSYVKSPPAAGNRQCRGPALCTMIKDIMWHWHASAATQVIDEFLNGLVFCGVQGVLILSGRSDK